MRRFLHNRARGRRGAVLVMVALSAAVLFGFTALVIDVNLWKLQNQKLKYATEAAAMAGFERLKELDFDYSNPATRRSVDAIIREYLVMNGLSREEAAAARISVDKLNRITVTVSHKSPVLFGRVAGVSSSAGRGRIIISGAARLVRTNNICPFAIPPEYHDPDHDQMPNYLTSLGKEGIIGATAKYELYHPYIIKYGKPLISQNENLILIPMDTQEYVIPEQAFEKLKIPITGGRFAYCKEAFHVPAQHADRSDIYHVGIFRAYGLAYKVLGLERSDFEKPSVSWLLGFAGGSFLIKEKYLEAAGFVFKEDELSEGRIFTKEGEPTNVVAVRLRLEDPRDRYFVKHQAFMRYLTDVLQDPKHPKIKVLVLTHQPQICTFTGSADPVTRIMDYAGIPYVGINDGWDPRFNRDHRSMCVDCYKITDRYPHALDSPESFFKFLENAPNAAGGRGFDWLHIHHEDFTENGRYPDEKRAIVEGIRLFVRKGHHHLFAACLAIETLEIFLAESVFGPDPVELVREMLDFDNTFAFTDFDIDKSRGGTEKVGWISSIDGESHGDKARWFLTDYLNPRCQNHDGFGGIHLDLDRYPAELTPPTSDPARLMVAPEGSTNTMRRDVLKPYLIPEHDGTTIESLSRPLLLLGLVGSPVNGIRTWKGKEVRYLTGVADDDSDLKNGHGEFTYLGGHRPADEVEGTWTLVGNLYEGTFYDAPHTLIPEELKELLPDGSVRTVEIDWNGDGKIEGFAPLWFIAREDKGYKPRSVDPAPTATSGWPTQGHEPHGINSKWCRWTQRTGEPNYEAPENTSSARIMDINNDGDCDDVFIDCCYIKYKPNIPGHRIYLDNILYGAMAVKKEEEAGYNLGAVNPAGLRLGGKKGDFGSKVSVGASNSYLDMLKYGFVSRKGLGIGSIIETAPGDFEKQTMKGLDFCFKDRYGQIDSVLWAQSDRGRKAGPGQIKIVPVVERVDDPAKSIYYGTKPHKVRIIGFARFFVVNPQVDTLTFTEDRNSIHYLGGPPLPGEIRGYFLGWVVEPKPSSMRSTAVKSQRSGVKETKPARTATTSAVSSSSSTTGSPSSQ